MQRIRSLFLPHYLLHLIVAQWKILLLFYSGGVQCCPAKKFEWKLRSDSKVSCSRILEISVRSALCPKVKSTSLQCIWNCIREREEGEGKSAREVRASGGAFTGDQPPTYNPWWARWCSCRWWWWWWWWLRWTIRSTLWWERVPEEKVVMAVSAVWSVWQLLMLEKCACPGCNNSTGRPMRCAMQRILIQWQCISILMLNRLQFKSFNAIQDPVYMQHAVCSAVYSSVQFTLLASSQPLRLNNNSIK